MTLSTIKLNSSIDLFLLEMKLIYELKYIFIKSFIFKLINIIFILKHLFYLC